VDGMQVVLVGGALPKTLERQPNILFRSGRGRSVRELRERDRLVFAVCRDAGVPLALTLAAATRVCTTRSRVAWRRFEGGAGNVRFVTPVRPGGVARLRARSGSRARRLDEHQNRAADEMIVILIAVELFERSVIRRTAHGEVEEGS
jgi:hypothetical protein